MAKSTLFPRVGEAAGAEPFTGSPAAFLVRSRFLVRLPGRNGEAIFFHSLYGTSLVLNPEAEALLDFFQTPTTIARALALSRRGNLLPPIRRLVERRFLVNPAADEREEFARRMRPEAPETGAHLHCLVLLAAEQCNLACPYCIKDRLMGLRPDRRQARMPLETAREAIDAFLALAARNGRNDLYLQFRGGESLLNAAVVLEATRYMRARWERGPVHASLVTNATLVTEATAGALADLRISAEVSIDGPRAVHDAVRFTKGGLPTYDVVLAGLARLRAAGVEVTNINATVTAETLPSIGPPFLATLARHGVRYLNLEPDVLRPAYPDPRALAARLLALRTEGRAHGIVVSGCWARGLRAINEVCDGAALPPPGDYGMLVVDALGKVVPWEYNGEDDLGPVADLPAVLASPAFRHHVESRSPGQIPECVGCEVEGLCQGNASLALVYERATGRPGLFAHRCELIRALTRGVLAEPDPPL
jgi:sulfatase maturation enzyme AslB (radical SAM superfamily)